MENYNYPDAGDELMPVEMNSNRGVEVEPIYIMTVELEEGKSQTIKIYADSSPSDLAFEFCKRNDLDSDAMNYLSEQIEILLNELIDNKLQSQVENIANSGGSLHNSGKKGLFKSSNIENNSIQEVDEEEYQTDTRKSNKSGNRYSNSQSPNSQVPIGDLCEKNHNNLKTNSNNVLDMGVVVVENINHKIENQIPGRVVSEISNDQLTINYPSAEQTISYDACNNISSINNSKQEIQKKNLQGLFTYDVFYNNFKKASIDKSMQRSIDKNASVKGSLSNTQTEHKEDKWKIKKPSVETKNFFNRKDNPNYGQILYEKSLIKRQEITKRNEYFRREREEKNSELYTHKPIQHRKVENQSMFKCSKDEYIKNYNQFLSDRLEKLMNKYKNKKVTLKNTYDKTNSGRENNTNSLTNKILENAMLNKILIQKLEIFKKKSEDRERINLEVLGSPLHTKKGIENIFSHRNRNQNKIFHSSSEVSNYLYSDTQRYIHNGKM